MRNDPSIADDYCSFIGGIVRSLIGRHRALPPATIAQQYSDPFAVAPPAPEEAPEVPSVSQLAPAPTPLLDLLASYALTPDEAGAGPEPAWAAADLGYLNQGEVEDPSLGYLNQPVPNPDLGYLNHGAESAAPVNSGGGYLSDEVAVPPPAVAPEPEPVLAGPRRSDTADPDREVAHPEGWWEGRRIDVDEPGGGFDTSGAYPARQLHATFRDEELDAVAFRGTGGQFSRFGDRPDERAFTRTATQHWNQATRDAHRVTVDGGRLHVGGGRLDTGGASGVGTMPILMDGQRVPTGKGKFIYAMDKDGGLTTADSWEEHREVDLGETVDGKEANELRMVNHSTLLGGEGAAGAGELTVEDGVLQQVTDASGHYRPTGAMTANVLRELGGRGVDLHDVATRLTGADRNHHVSAREVLATQASLDAQGSTTDLREVVAAKRRALSAEVATGRTHLRNHVDVGAIEEKQRKAEGLRGPKA